MREGRKGFLNKILFSGFRTRHGNLFLLSELCTELQITGKFEFGFFSHTTCTYLLYNPAPSYQHFKNKTKCFKLEIKKWLVLLP